MGPDVQADWTYWRITYSKNSLCRFLKSGYYSFTLIFTTIPSIFFFQGIEKLIFIIIFFFFNCILAFFSICKTLCKTTCLKQNLFPFTVSLRVFCHLKVCIHLDGAICIPWGVPSSTYQARTRDLPAREGLHLFLIIPSDFSQTVWDINRITDFGLRYPVNVWHYLLSDSLTAINSNYSIFHFDFYRIKDEHKWWYTSSSWSTFGVRMNYLCCPDLLFHY